MTTLLALIVFLGLAPWALGLALLRPARALTPMAVDLGAVLLLALAFTLTFFWQELWLVIPKALTPGLHPTLYHNDHNWTGQAANVELLEGSGALATLASGLMFLTALSWRRQGSATWRMGCFWMAFEGVNQSFTQLAVGTFLPGNDVGRALAHLHAGAVTKWSLLVLAVIGLAVSGMLLAHAYPHHPGHPGEPRLAVRSRSFAGYMLRMALLAMVPIVLLRMPRNLVEVVLVPLLIQVVGIGWLTLGACSVHDERYLQSGRVNPLGPALALGATLLLFQCVLRPGIQF